MLQPKKHQRAYVKATLANLKDLLSRLFAPQTCLCTKPSTLHLARHPDKHEQIHLAAPTERTSKTQQKPIVSNADKLVQADEELMPTSFRRFLKRHRTREAATARQIIPAEQ